MARPLKIARFPGILQIWAGLCAEIGDGSARSASCLRRRILVSRFSERYAVSRKPSAAAAIGSSAKSRLKRARNAGR